MDRTGHSARRLIELVKAETGHTISPTMMSFILRGSRRCSLRNALDLHAVTGVPLKVLTQWPKVSGCAKVSVKRSSNAA